jgi:hypothetical protein
VEVVEQKKLLVTGLSRMTVKENTFEAKDQRDWSDTQVLNSDGN